MIFDLAILESKGNTSMEEQQQRQQEEESLHDPQSEDIG